LAPGIGVTLEVHDGENEDAVGADLVEDRIRETPDEAATRTDGKDRAWVGEGMNAVEDGLHLLNVLVAKSGTLIVVS
jgi:hypothetical protein